MSNRYQGKQGKYSKKVDRIKKRNEAEIRQANVVLERTKAYRLANTA